MCGKLRVTGTGALTHHAPWLLRTIWNTESWCRAGHFQPGYARFSTTCPYGTSPNGHLFVCFCTTRATGTGHRHTLATRVTGTGALTHPAELAPMDTECCVKGNVLTTRNGALGTPNPIRCAKGAVLARGNDDLDTQPTEVRAPRSACFRAMSSDWTIYGRVRWPIKHTIYQSYCPFVASRGSFYVYWNVEAACPSRLRATKEERHGQNA